MISRQQEDIDQGSKHVIPDFARWVAGERGPGGEGTGTERHGGGTGDGGGTNLRGGVEAGEVGPSVAGREEVVASDGRGGGAAGGAFRRGASERGGVVRATARAPRSGRGSVPTRSVGTRGRCCERRRGRRGAAGGAFRRGASERGDAGASDGKGAAERQGERSDAERRDEGEQGVASDGQGAAERQGERSDAERRNEGEQGVASDGQGAAERQGERSDAERRNEGRLLRAMARAPGAAGGAFRRGDSGTRREPSAVMRVFWFVEGVISMLTISWLAIPYCLQGKKKRQKYKTKSMRRA